MGLTASLRHYVLTVLLLILPLSAQAESTFVQIKTDKGSITLELYTDKAPASVKNFMDYANRYFYDGMIFHRIVNGFVIQSGGYTWDLSKKEPGDPVVNESDNGLKNLRGTIAMARMSDPDSATSQFFINLKDNPNLDPSDSKAGYTVFGKVIEGYDVVDEIGKVPSMRSGKFTDLPVDPIQILSVRELESP